MSTTKKIAIALLLLFPVVLRASSTTLQLLNNTVNQIAYPNEGLTLPANSTTLISGNALIPLSQDPAANNDLLLGNTTLGDTVNTYSGEAAIDFLASAASAQGMLDKTGSGSLTAAQATEGTAVSGGTVVINANGSSSVGATISGTWSGTIVADGTFDGTNWFTMSPVNLSTGSMVLSTTSNTSFLIGSGGCVQVRLRMSTYVSGTANITYNAAVGTNVVLASNTVASNLNAQVTSASAAKGTPTQINVSCGTSSTTLLAANTATKFLTIRNPANGAATAWIRFDGGAAATAAPSYDLPTGAEKSFYASENSFLPTAQLNCISGGITATTVTLIYK